MNAKQGCLALCCHQLATRELYFSISGLVLRSFNCEPHGEDVQGNDQRWTVKRVSAQGFPPLARNFPTHGR